MSLLEDRHTLWIVATLIVVLFAMANLPWQLDDYDQAKQAFTSFEMVKEGHWLYQQTPHERVATKPPLVGWISAGLFGVTGSWEIAWRLPSLLAALALAFVLFRAAKDAYGKVAALIAVSAFGLNLLSPRLATLVRTDMPLTLVIFLVGVLIWRKIREGNEWKLRDQIYCGDADQRSDCLRFCAAGHCAQCRSAAGDARTSHYEAGTCLGRLVAMDRFTRDFPRVGSCWHSVSARILRGSCDARIRRAFW